MIFLGRLRYGILCILFCLSVMVLTFSCSAADQHGAFLTRLDRIDVLVRAGDTRDALRELVRLRKKAVSAGQWLSLVKRERQLDAHIQAVDTLVEALIGLPANESLAAVMTDTLVGLGRYEEALDYADILLLSPYMAVAARAGIEYLLANGPGNAPDPAYFNAAYRVSGKSGYLVAAAVLHAQRGAYHEACSLMLPVRDPAYRYLTALLCYDAGYHEKHRSLYPESLVVHSYPAEESLLLSDSLYRLGLVDDARHVWQDLITVYPGYSPVPYYNLSKTGSADGRGTKLLSDCLDIFPAYYPAIALYTHAVRSFQDSSRDDPVAGALRSAGFSSMRMDADADIERPDAGEALRKIARGMSDPSGIHDPRLHIERIRLNPYRNDPTERTEAMVWKLLERFPDSTLSHDYALWYFLSSGSYDTAFSLNANHPEGPRPLYSALESALLGNAGQSIDYFMEMANDDNLAWLGLADAALVHYRLGNKETALEDLILAASMAPNRIQESRIQYHIAVLLESMRLMDRAESVLGYALELNPENHLARAMLGKIRAGK
ncbi:MAG TPA: hypothetical protein PLS27_01750 [Treponemataceae bacterium]|nr:hypothetical protein [Treponemataceae bacterium]